MKRSFLVLLLKQNVVPPMCVEVLSEVSGEACGAGRRLRVHHLETARLNFPMTIVLTQPSIDSPSMR